MTQRDNPLFWSFSLGTWIGVQVRLSVWFFAAFLLWCVRLGWDVGLVYGAIVLVSVLLHEFGHVIGTRATGGSADEILMWPLGGLAMVQPANTLTSQLVSTIFGPLVNLVIFIALLPAALKSGQGAVLFNPLKIPAVDLAADPVFAVMLLGFSANWTLFLISMIPAYPLDGGRIVKSLAHHFWGNELGTEWYFVFGFLSAVVLVFAGLLADSAAVVFLGTVVIVLTMHEFWQHRHGDSFDDSFMGYDFSQGYTSLERNEREKAPPRKGWLARWKENRRRERERQDRERAAWLEQQVDALLIKIHEQGEQSLTPAEKALLKQAGTRYRDKGKDEN